MLRQTTLRHPDLAAEDLEEILAVFVPESREHVERLELALSTLARDPDDCVAIQVAIQVAFRAIHSIEGNAGFLGLEPLEALAHEITAILARVRGAGLRAEAAVVTRLTEQLDSLRHMLDIVEAQRQLLFAGRRRHRASSPQPVAGLWTRLPHLVRALSLELGKHARVVTDGGETELDAAILEELADPLLHLVRNAVDHGIESPTDRCRLGKPAEATISLRAARVGGWVRIELSDDGAGVDLDQLRARARATGLIADHELDELDERSLLELLFRPGFSTRSTISKFSGCGVGLDVVKANVESLGGVVDLLSCPGRGTTVKLEIPRTQTCPRP